MSLIKSVANVQDWTAVAQAAIGESAVLDCSTFVESVLSIQAFLDTTTAHTGTEFIIQTSAATTGDEDWQDFCRFVELIHATPLTVTITNNPAAAGTTVLTSGTVAAGWAVADLSTRWIGIKNSTLINSELGLQVGYANNTSVTIQDGTTNEHAQNTTVHLVAFTKEIMIPISFNRVRVVINNNYDNNGSTLNYKVRVSKVTAL